MQPLPKSGPPKYDYVSRNDRRFRRFGKEHIFISQASQLELFHDNNLWEAVVTNKVASVLKYSHEQFEVRRGDSGVFERYGKRGNCERGGEGESILHLAVLFKNTKMVKRIIKSFPGLVNSIYLKSLYFGETPLHLAAVNSDNDKIVNILVTNKAKVNGPAVSGKQFLKEGDRGALYFGQTILQFAAATHKKSIVKYLVENEDDPAELDTVDIYGNNVLHIMAYYEDFDFDIFTYLKQRNYDDIEKAKIKQRSDPTVRVPANLMLARNKDKLTPFQLGVMRGNSRVIDTMKELQWVFGSVRHYSVCIDDFDPLQPHYDKLGRVSKSAVEIAAERGDKNVLDHPLFDALLKIKWNLYIRQKFLIRFIATVLLVFCFTIAVGLQPYAFADRRTYDEVSVTNKYPATRGFFECATVFGIVLLLLGEFKEFSVEGVGYFSGFGTGENYIQWIFSICVLAIPILRFGVASDVRVEQWSYMVDTENIFFSIGAIVGWIYLLNFSKGFNRIGPLVIVFKKILTGDLMQWLALYVSITAGFSAALYLQMNDVPQETIGESVPVFDWNTYFGAVLWTVRFIFAQALFDDLRRAKQPAFALILFVTYGFFVLILLLNVLIAKLVETFKEVSKHSKKEWMVLFAYLIIDMDQKLTIPERKFLLEHLGWHKSEKLVTPRHLLFTERDVPDPDDPEHVSTETLKIVVAVDAGGNDIEINIDSDHWKVWYNDLIKPFRKMRSQERAHLWSMNHLNVSQKGNVAT
ncbi:hypothetical protein HDU82_004605 [Entophlyctis luteolus]|nr:hypothetical protein HDU82_004605 [Entophlyctis luteolus]